MKCPHCGSANVEVPTVDIGVGEQQCGPAGCNDCHAVQMTDISELGSTEATAEERRVGWWRGTAPQEPCDCTAPQAVPEFDADGPTQPDVQVEGRTQQGEQTAELDPDEVLADMFRRLHHELQAFIGTPVTFTTLQRMLALGREKLKPELIELELHLQMGGLQDEMACLQSLHNDVGDETLRFYFTKLGTGPDGEQLAWADFKADTNGFPIRLSSSITRL